MLISIENTIKDDLPSALQVEKTVAATTRTAKNKAVASFLTRDMMKYIEVCLYTALSS